LLFGFHFAGHWNITNNLMPDYIGKVRPNQYA